ncbi:MAG: hypothetical protein ABI353_18945 [Isosphaeraceae bacterium]
MSCSDARQLANQRNAQKSTGPKTETGKLAARLNSLTHGMRSEHGLVPRHLTDAVAKHHDMLIDAYRPDNDRQSWLLGQVADAAARLDYCQFMIRAQIDDMADRADFCWDEDRARAVEEIAARLPKDPSRTASRLRETAQGCRWILARWDALGVPLIENTPWDEAQCNLAATLMGVGADLRASYPTLTPSANPSDQAAIMCEHADGIHTLMVEALEPLDAKERELTRLGYALHPSKELLRFQRYETKLRRVLNDSLNEFRRVRSEGFHDSEPITMLAPEAVAEPVITLPLAEPVIEPAPCEPPAVALEGEPEVSRLLSLIEAFATIEEAPPEPSPMAPSVSPSFAKPSRPLNRHARRAQAAAARKSKVAAR